MTQDQGKGEEPMSALLILFNTAIIRGDGGGDCPLKGVGDYMKNGFGSELFLHKLGA